MRPFHSLQGRLEAIRHCAALPNYRPALTRYWMLPSRLKVRRWAMEQIAQISFDRWQSHLELRFPTGDVLYSPDSGSCWDTVHAYLTVAYMGQYFQRQRPKPDDIVLDIGANVGAFALSAARLVGPTGRVHCFEPVPANVAALRKTVEANGLTNVTVSEAAVADVPGRLSLHLAPSGSGHSGVFDSGLGDITVAQTTVDRAVAELTLARVDFVKIDVEGMEAAVLHGAAELLRRHRPFVVAAAYHRPGDRENLVRILGELEPSYVIYCEEGPAWADPDVTATRDGGDRGG